MDAVVAAQGCFEPVKHTTLKQHPKKIQYKIGENTLHVMSSVQTFTKLYDVYCCPKALIILPKNIVCLSLVYDTHTVMQSHAS